MSLDKRDVIDELKKINIFITEGDFEDIQIVGIKRCHCCGKETGREYLDGNLFRRVVRVAIEELEWGND